MSNDTADMEADATVGEPDLSAGGGLGAHNVQVHQPDLVSAPTRLVVGRTASGS
jgi:hypothetical protein